MQGPGAREEAAAAMREKLVTSPQALPDPVDPDAGPEPDEGPMSDAAARQQQELQAEGNVVSACSIFAAITNPEPVTWNMRSFPRTNDCRTSGYSLHRIPRSN